MSDRADAHIHLFEGGYRGQSFARRDGVSIDEPRCFASLAQEHGVHAALIVGYTAEPWCQGNNDYLASQRPRWPWLYPVAFVDPTTGLTTAGLDALAQQGFVGISLYLFTPEAIAAVQHLGDEIWRWLTERRWLVSVNSRGDNWRVWPGVLERFAELRLLVSHVGLPPRVAGAPSRDQAVAALQPVLDLARYPGPRVKLSGLYALTDPGHDYPHRAAWPYLQAVTDAFGVHRLLWASDFSPCLDWLSYPQTLGVLRHLPWLDDAARQSIEGGNLLALLRAASGN